MDDNGTRLMETSKRLWITGGMLMLSTACADGSLAPQALQEDTALRERLEPLVERAMDRELIPGLQMTVVTRDGRFWSGAFGVEDMDTGSPVTDESRFYIASTTKALTALAAARLAHRSELDLDASLAEAFPAGTRFHPEYDPTAATVRDLLTHTHGLRQGGISYRVAFTGQYSNDTTLALLERHPPLPNRDFRYSNFGYDLVGLLLAPRVTRGWKEVVEREVLEPLGMANTTAYRSRIADSLIAWPHEVGPDGMGRIRLAKGDPNLGPAGGHFTTATDLARLLLAEMNEGRLLGRQVVPAPVIAETQRPQVPQAREFLHYDRHAWGLGWDIGTVAGDTVIHRPGGFAGYYANAAFLPRHGFGVVVLTNGGGGGARFAEIVAGAIYDEMRGRSEAVARMDAALDELAGALEGRRRRIAERLAGLEFADTPPRPLAAYTGHYGQELRGTVEVVIEDDRLVVRSGMVEGTLRPLAVDGDVFFTQMFDVDDEVTFVFEDGEQATGLRIRGTEETFRRKG